MKLFRLLPRLLCLAALLCSLASAPARAACGPIPPTYPLVGGSLSLGLGYKMNNIPVFAGTNSNRAISTLGAWTSVTPSTLLPTIGPAFPPLPGWIIALPLLTITPDDYWTITSLGLLGTVVAQPGNYTASWASLSGGFEFGAGDYYIDDLSFGLGSTITTNGTARLFIGNTLTIGAGTSVNQTGTVGSLQIYVYNGSSVSVGSGVSFKGVMLGETGTTIQFGASSNIQGAVLSAGTVQFGTLGTSLGAHTYSAADATAVGAINTCGAPNVLKNFTVNPGGASANTCSPKSITFTAKKADGTVMTSYTGTMTLSTSTGRGDWAKVTGGGAFNNGTANDGIATYTFVAADAGQAVLSLDNERADDLTVTATDASVAGSASTSATIQFRDNALVIDVDESSAYLAGNNNNPYVAVAGRPHRMKAEVWRKDASTGNRCQIANNFGGNVTMRFWVVNDALQPAGVTLPSIAISLSGNACGSSTALSTATPVATTATLNFSAGKANFYLCPSDIGKYRVSGQINPATQVGTGLTALDASSNVLTVRPFGIAISGLSSAGNGNGGGTAATDAVFGVAGMPFSATLTAYAYNPSGSVDANGDGHPDSGQNLTQLDVAARRLNNFAGSVTLGIKTGVAGQTVGALSNPNVTLAGGTAIATTLAYSEVGSFAWLGAADSSPILTSFLGTTVTVYPQGFTASGAQSPTVGRFKPHHFTLTGNSVTPFCASGNFTYMGQPQLNPQFTVEARNAANALTVNYTGTLARAGSGVAVVAENANNGTSLSSRLSGLSGSWSGGVWTSLSTGRLTFSAPATATSDATWGPYDALQLGAVVTDPDADASVSMLATNQSSRPKFAGRSLNDSNASCTADIVSGESDGNCNAVALGSSTRLRYGRAALGRASSYGQPLRMPSELQYWSGSTWGRHTQDSCSAPPPVTLRYCPINAGNQIASGQTSASAYATAQSGQLGVTVAVPTPNATSRRRDGIVDLSLSLATQPWLVFGWGAANDCAGTAFIANEPRARAQFFSGNNAGNLLYQREVY